MTGRARLEARRLAKGAQRRAWRAWQSLGDEVECCFCEWSGRQFRPAGLGNTPNRKCPRCGSLERYRTLYFFLQQRTTFFTQPTTVLEAGPKACFTDLCRSLPNIRHLGVGLDGAVSVRTDLTALALTSESIDVVICFHVLEHIRDDAGALAELWRVLRPAGRAIVQVPVRGERTFEDPHADPRDYERLFGQSDHVRWYGLDLVQRLGAAGFDVELERPLEWLDEELVRRHALRGDDRLLFVARKRGAQP
jgi:SAM-dependent methyltransferase